MAKRILIADDEPNIVVSLEFLMKKMGYVVRVANTGADALDAVREFEPDLILLDIMMPQMSGFDLCQTVRENAAWKGIKILMLSAKGRQIDMSKGMGVGADAYVTKPFSTRELVAKVRELLGD